MMVNKSTNSDKGFDLYYAYLIHVSIYIYVYIYI